MQGRIHGESACGPSSVTIELVHHAFLCREAGCFKCSTMGKRNNKDGNSALTEHILIFTIPSCKLDNPDQQAQTDE
jgi:hypothetical protein